MNSSSTPNHWSTDDSSTPEPQLSEWEWLAFCYLADELSPEQRLAFEQQLETNAEAQQALVLQLELTEQIAGAASATRLTTTLSDTLVHDQPTARPERLPRALRSSSHKHRWLAAAAALFILGSAGIGWQIYRSQSLTQLAEIQLADEWVYQMSQLPDAERVPSNSLTEIDPWENSEMADSTLTSGTEKPTGEYWSELPHDENSDENSWIYAAAMALEDDDFEWLPGILP